MKRYLCIHGHFYQPPRENPWLEQVEVQDSAYPYHDWNERITNECYRPNSAARLVDHENRILDIVNNYTKISFNFGPTLLSWMERAQPDVYAKILEADRISVRQRGGHGNALAQVYNHLIMPLASRRDKVTQVRWGIADFESRFKRKPEGMWLPETAVDLETLEVLAEEGIRLTVLAPHQANRIRLITDLTGEALYGEGDEKEAAWIDVSGNRVDPTRPYRCFLKNGLFIDLFFYDGPISHAVAFDQLLRSGENFVERLKGGFSDVRSWPQLLHIATDGESYGHHFPHGDMALAYTLQQIEQQQIAELTNYGEYLSKNPPKYEVEILEKSSWSCAHGVERWRSNCGCQIGANPGWNQTWRPPLREALDGLKEALDLIFETKGKKWLKDPYEVRDAYIEMIRKRETDALTWDVVDQFFSRYQTRSLNILDREEVVKLLEMQRNALLMFTSCAWFFDEISGLEATQGLKYAGRALQLAKEIDPSGGVKVEGPFLEKLKEAKSNLAEFGNGAEIYQRLIRPSMINPKRVIAHFAIVSLLEEHPQGGERYAHSINLQDYQHVTDGTVTLAIGRVRAASKITFGIEEAIFGVLHFGGSDFYCAVRGMFGTEEYDRMKSDLIEKFYHDSHAAVVRSMNHYFGGDAFTLKDLFLEERRKVLYYVARILFSRYENTWRQIYLDHQKLMVYLQSIQAKIPKPFLATAEQVLNHDLSKEKALLPDPGAFDRIVQIVEESKKWGVELQMDDIEKEVRALLIDRMNALIQSGSRETLEAIHRLLNIAEKADLKMNLWETQNLFHHFIKKHHPEREESVFDAVQRELIAKLAKRLSYLFG